MPAQGGGLNREWDGSALMGMGYYRAIRVVEADKKPGSMERLRGCVCTGVFTCMVSCSRGRKASDKAVIGWLPKPTPGAKEQEDKRGKEGKQAGEL